ncbi:MAG: hypothetical protein IPL65_17835 [Lewinellaceae bacterium]|nr:hypothetical protein [Lewinellaceae bacterium]
MLELFDAIVRTEKPEKKILWAILFPSTPYDDTRIRLLLSYLNRLMEQFLLVEDLKMEDYSLKLKLAVIYRHRGISGQYERSMKFFQKNLLAQPQRNENFYGLQRLYEIEVHETELIRNPTNTAPFRELARSTDLFYLTGRLRLICLELSQTNVYQADAMGGLHLDIIALAERTEWADLPGISTYLAAIRMLKEEGNHKAYEDFLKKMERQKFCFSDDEMREFYKFSINHCIRSANRGSAGMEEELLTQYRKALEGGYLYENGVLSRFTFHNIVAAGLRCNELKWVQDFIERYQEFIEPEYRDSSVSFNSARLHFTRRAFDKVLLLLQKANYNDPLLYLAAKTLLLKTYFALDEYDLIHANLDAMRNYLQRKKVLGYHRINYQNIIRFTERILNSSHDRQQRTALRRDIESEVVLTEKEWLLGLLD